MSLTTLKREVTAELNRILAFWTGRALDYKQGGVIGKIDNDNRLYPEADKGLVLHARVLWTFAAAGVPDQTEWVYDYIVKQFIDDEYGGVYWTVDHQGRPADTKKQVYAQAFALYAFSEYNKTDQAIGLYQLIEQHSYDKEKGGYIEAFSRTWKPLDDLRLSEKDANEKKTMNTHLHILEAYTNLYRRWPNVKLENSIRELLDVFDRQIIDHKTKHTRLFFDEEWYPKGHGISFGHDIETSWLLLEAAEEIGYRVKYFQQLAVMMTDAVMKAVDADGGLWYEDGIPEKHWWPQAEALVGFINAWQITGERKYVNYALNTWSFIKDHILDHTNGEWYWGIRADFTIMQEDKAGLWKCPYHNARACLELIKRIGNISNC